MINKKTPASSVIAQIDARGLNSREEDDDDDDDDDLDTNVNGWGTPEDVRDCDGQSDPTLAENVGVSTLLPCSSTRNYLIQHPSALLSDNISKPLSSVSEVTSPCMLFPLTEHER